MTSHILAYCEMIRRGDEYLPRLLSAFKACEEADEDILAEGETQELTKKRDDAYANLKKTVDEFDPARIAIVPKQVREEYFNILEPMAKGEDPDYYLDLSSVPILGANGEEMGRKGPAQRYIDFIEATCVIPEGDKAGQNIRLEPFQKAYAEALLASKDRITNRRRFNESPFTVARKNGKTALLSTLGLYGTVDIAGAKVYCAATSKEQASQVYDAAVGYVDANPLLSANWRHRVFPRTEMWIGNSYFRVLPNETKRQDGLKVSLGIIDEIHALPRKIYDLLNQATTAFPEPLIVMIGSAGFLSESLYKDKTELAEKVAAEVISNPHFLGLNYSQEGDKRIVLGYEPPIPRESEAERARRELRNAARRIQWRKSNPGLGTIKDERQMERIVITALQDPNGLPEVLTKEFNIVSAESARIFLQPEEIVSRSTRAIVTDEEINAILDDCPGVIGGLDLSLDNDLSAFITLVFDRKWDGGNGRVIALCQVWASREFIEQQESGGEMRRNTSADVPWQAWIAKGYVRIGGEHYIDPANIVGYKYAPITDVTGLVEGSKVIIANTENSVAMAGQKASNREEAAITIDDNGNAIVTNDSKVQVFTLEIAGGSTTLCYFNTGSGYIYAASKSANQLKTQQDADVNAKARIAFDEEGTTVIFEDSENRNHLQYNKNSKLFSCYAENNSQKPVQLYKQMTVAANVTAVGYATFSSTEAVDFTDVEDIYAYTASVEGDAITFSRITKVPANTGVLLRSIQGGEAAADVPVLDAAPAVEGNALVAVAATQTVATGSTNYILNQSANGGAGFYLAAGNTVAAGKAYLHVEGATSVKSFAISFDDIETAITGVNAARTDAAIYNLAGQRVSQPVRGLYIVGGRKVIVK